jgi:hypothetical protein
MHFLFFLFSSLFPFLFSPFPFLSFLSFPYFSSRDLFFLIQKGPSLYLSLSRGATAADKAACGRRAGSMVLDNLHQHGDEAGFKLLPRGTSTSPTSTATSPLPFSEVSFSTLEWSRWL